MYIHARSVQERIWIRLCARPSAGLHTLPASASCAGAPHNTSTAIIWCYYFIPYLHTAMRQSFYLANTANAKWILTENNVSLYYTIFDFN